VIELKKISCPTVDASTVKNPVAGDLLGRFRALGHTVRIKDFSLGLGFPAIGAVRQLKRGLYVITAGVAASRDEALVRALTENSQGEGSVEENQRKEPAIRHLCGSTKAVPWSAVPDIRDRNIKVELERMEALLRRQGMTIYCMDTTDPALDVPSVLVVVTGAKVLDARFSHRTILSGLLNEALWLDDIDGADSLLDAAEKKDPRNLPLYLFGRAVCLRRRSRYAEAVKYFGQYLSLKKNSIPLFEDRMMRRNCLFNLGICSLALRRQEKAAGYFRKLLAGERDFSLTEMRAAYESIPSLAKDMPLLDRAEKFLYRIRETAA
jgi:tetratricopeptide (TPR) repeat protein